MKTVLTCTVNGIEHTVLADARDTLLDLLRDRIGLTGTKEGCGNGNCGTCTVLMDGATVNACLILAFEAPGRDIVTIEGLERDGRRQLRFGGRHRLALPHHSIAGDSGDLDHVAIGARDRPRLRRQHVHRGGQAHHHRKNAGSCPPPHDLYPAGYFLPFFGAAFGRSLD